MKQFNTLTFIVSFFIAGAANAQINKGATFLGGDIGGAINTTKLNGNETTKEESITISPVFGKAIRQNLVLGFDAIVNLAYSQQFGSPGNRQRGYGLGVFLRKYGQLGKSGFYLFLQGRLGGAYHKSIANAVQLNEAKIITTSLSAYPGLSYRISRRLQLETGFNNLLSINYSRAKSIGTPAQITQKSTSFNVSTSLNNLSSLYAGFRLLIN